MKEGDTGGRRFFEDLLIGENTALGVAIRKHHDAISTKSNILKRR